MRTKFNKYIYLLILIIIYIFVLFNFNYSSELDEQTKILCKWYAKLDHRKEITDERYEKISYLWLDFDWYKSCINQVQNKYEK